MRTRCRQYPAALGAAEVAYAAKALTCRAVPRWIAREGLGLRVCSAGQLAAAAAVGFPAGRTATPRPPADLRHALSYGVGTVVIESSTNVARLAALARGRQKVLPCVLPGPGADPAAGLPTGPDADRFGLPAGALSGMLRRIADQPRSTWPASTSTSAPRSPASAGTSARSTSWWHSPHSAA